MAAACSPKHYSGERTAVSTQRSVLADSASVSRWLRESLSEALCEQIETTADTESETVREVLSAPDSTGTQYVVQREVIRQSGRSETKAGRKVETGRQLEEVADSIRTVEQEVQADQIQEESVEVKTRRAVPWWAFLVGIAAVACAAYYALRRASR